jgi:hypothetical protein
VLNRTNKLAVSAARAFLWLHYHHFFRHGLFAPSPG